MHTFECRMIIDVLLQPYAVDQESTTFKGFEYTGTPEGIPSQAEYLAEYCSAAVCISSVVTFYFVAIHYSFAV